MNLKELKELIELVSEKDFTEFEIERQGFRMRICRSKEPAAQLPSAATPVTVPAPVPAPVDLNATAERETAVETAQPSATASSEARTAQPSADDENVQIIKSPIVGTFYRAPSPNSEPFARIGDHVEQDTVVCIIEAMKLMNEIQAEMTGEVVKIFVENGQPVEYGQPLFGIKT